MAGETEVVTPEIGNEENGVMEGKEVKEVTEGADGTETTEVKDVKETKEAEKKEKEPRKEVPKPDVRHPVPNHAELEEKVNAQKEIRQKAMENIARLRDSFEKRNQAVKVSREGIDELHKVKNELYTTMREKIDAKKKLNEQIRALKQQDIDSASKNTTKDFPKTLKGMTKVEDVEAKIKALEYRHSAESLSVREETTIVNEISYLQREGMEFIIKYQEQVSTAEASKGDRKKKAEELEQLRKKMDGEINKLQEKLDSQKKSIEKARDAQTAQVNEITGPTADVKYDEEKQKRKEANEEINRLYAEYDKKFKEYKASEQQWKEYDRYRKQLKYEQIQAEKEAKRREYEQALADIPPPDPYEDEKAMCSSLMTYLHELDPSISQEEVKTTSTPAEQPAKTNNVREISAEGTTIGKTKDGMDDDSKYSAFGKGKKSKRGKGTRAPADPEKKLQVHSIDRYTAFHKLGIKPPTTVSEIPATIQEVKKKQEYYATAPPPKEKEETEPKAGKSKSKKPTPPQPMLEDGDLPDGVPKPSEGPAVDTGSRPSFKDIIRGKAAAAPEEFPVAALPTDVKDTVAVAESNVTAEVTEEQVLPEDGFTEGAAAEIQ